MTGCEILKTPSFFIWSDVPRNYEAWFRQESERVHVILYITTIKNKESRSEKKKGKIEGNEGT